MAKRSAGNDLNHNNWSEEEEPEEAGVFQVAASDVLKQRVVKKAKRVTTTTDSDVKTPFSGFTGFSKATNNSNPPSFEFLTGPKLMPSSNSSPAKTFPVKDKLTNGSPMNATCANRTASFDAVKSTSDSQDKDEDRKSVHCADFYQQLKDLNESAAAWIKSHVDKNPFCILTPIFKDYESHLKEMEKLNVREQQNSEQQNRTMTPDLGVSKNAEGFQKESLAVGPVNQLTESSPVSKSPEPKEEKPFSFAVAKPPTSILKAEDKDEEDDYKPPVRETKEVKEDGAFYSKKCKLFYKKNDAYVEKGLGCLHLKSVGEKTQLVIRADTNLGNILLNVMLTTSSPTQRVGKNNVTLICVPNPPLDKNASNDPVPFLIRVKTLEDADELLEKLDKAKS